MKKLLLFATLLIAGTAVAQDIPASRVPAAVSKAFKTKFPKATAPDWEKKGADYEVEFNVSMADHKAIYSETGKLLRYKRDIRNADLPAAVKRTIETDYKGFRIDDADRLEIGGVTYYQVELDGKPSDQKLVFTKDGKVDGTQQYW